MRYPAGWPIFLQQSIPSVMCDRANGVVLDWSDLANANVKAKEVGAAMEPQWIKSFIKGATESRGESKMSRMLPLLSLVAVILCLVMIFVLFTKIGGLQTAVESLKLLVK